MNRLFVLLLCLGIVLGQGLVGGYTGHGALYSQKKEKPKKNKKGNEEAKTIDPKTKERIDYLFIEANTQYLQEKRHEAIGLFKEVVVLDPKSDASLYNIGKISNELHDFQEGAKYCKMALDLKPDNYWYYTELVSAYQGLRDMGKALEVQLALSKKFPEDKNTLYDLAQLYIVNKDFTKAVETYSLLEKMTGPSEEISFRKHQLYLYTNQPDKAMIEIEQLISQNPQDSRYWQAKYDLLMMQQKTTEAQAVLKKMLEVDPNDGFALLALADYHKNKGEIAKSDEYLFNAFENPSVDLETKVKILSGMYPSAEKDPEVLARMDKMSLVLLRLHPKSAMVQGIRGDVLQAADQPDSARVYYRKSLALDPGNEQVWNELLIIDSEKNEPAALAKDAEKALEYFPNQLLFLYFFGVGSSQNGDNEEAKYAFEKIKKTNQLANKDVLLQVYLSLGELYQKEKDYAKSDENFEGALKLDPKSPLALNNYAYFLSLRGERLDDATKMVLQALDAEPNNGAYQDTYGWILYLQGKYQEAEQWIGKAVNAGGGSEVLEHYGDTLHKLGNETKAREYWQKAIEKGALFTMESKTSGDR